MLARRLPSILPPLALEEAIEVTAIHSVAGLLDGRPLVGSRPVRAPHCSISDAALLGGGTPIRPGEVTLAHRGVLFLDELPEYRRNVLEPLRQPLEERRITVARGAGALPFPAAFQLVAAMNPCGRVALLPRVLTRERRKNARRCRCHGRKDAWAPQRGQPDCVPSVMT